MQMLQIKLADKSIIHYSFWKILSSKTGITSAQEFFQKNMSSILANFKGMMCMINDVLVYGSSLKEHDERLKAVLTQLQNAGVTFNKEKSANSERLVCSF